LPYIVDMRAFLTGAAEKQLDRLNEPMAGRILDAIEGLECDPPKGDIKPLKGSTGVFRLKIGGYRILYEVENGNIKIFKIAPRGQVYRGKK